MGEADAAGAAARWTLELVQGQFLQVVQAGAQSPLMRGGPLKKSDDRDTLDQPPHDQNQSGKTSSTRPGTQ